MFKPHALQSEVIGSESRVIFQQPAASGQGADTSVHSRGTDAFLQDDEHEGREHG